MDEILSLPPYAERVETGGSKGEISRPRQSTDGVPPTEDSTYVESLRATLEQAEAPAVGTSSFVGRVSRRAKHLARRSLQFMPAPISERVVRERHLEHVTSNMAALTDPALMGNPPIDHVRWISQDQPRPSLPPALGLDQPNFEAIEAVREWLRTYPWDSDDHLDARMDNHGDEVGRARAALRTRVRLVDAPEQPHSARGNRVAFDARALQSAAFGTRGIGRFARAALISIREEVGDGSVTLLIDHALHPLPAELAGNCQQVTRVREDDVAFFGAVVSPSPMTHSPAPLVHLLHSTATRIAIVFDFIPAHLPTLYMPHVAARAEYAATLDALRLYDQFICISALVQSELPEVLARSVESSVVAWPRDVLVAGEQFAASVNVSLDGPIVLMTGDDPRKNTFGGLAGIAAATSHESERDVVVLGMAGQGTRVHHWSIAAAMRPGEATTAGRISDNELDELLASASCVVVPSFDEGLSLPVIEALRSGVPVIASDIPSHRELVGSGDFLCSPGSPRSIAAAVARVRGRSAVVSQQRARLRSHDHAVLEDVMAGKVAFLRSGRAADVSPASRPRGSRMSVGIATPWSPQQTGVADYSAATLSALARHVDLTVYTTTDAFIEPVHKSDVSIELQSVEEVFDDPEGIADRHDAFISIVGNSHYHLPFVQVLGDIDATVIAHDTRMIEFYMALRGRGGVEHLMLMTDDHDAPPSIDPSLDDQVGDMRLLQNAGFWEVARRAGTLAMHSPSSAPWIKRETGRGVHVLPFVNYRAPSDSTITEEQRILARRVLGLDHYPPGTIHLGSFGYVDTRTKLTDIVVEAAAWLTQWGYSVALHFIGSASPAQAEELTARAQAGGLAGFQITGFVSEEEFRQWLLAVDLGVQLRISPLLGVSGPLSDLAAYGTPAVASRGLCLDVDPPAFITPLPDAASPVMVAEAIEQALANPSTLEERERLRRQYLEEKSPARYAQALMKLLEATS